MNTLPESMPSPIPNRKLAEVWIGQAKYDFQALEVMYRAAESGNEELSAHVCFLAHQVAEKAVKAALAAKIGFSYEDLRGHDIVCPASKVGDEDLSLKDLPELVNEVDHYYLRTRYPNQCGDRIPSELLTLSKAEKAFNIGRKIFELVQKNLSVY